MFVAGYCMVWIAAGLPIAAAIIAVRVSFPIPTAAAVVICPIGFVWPCSPPNSFA